MNEIRLLTADEVLLVSGGEVSTGHGTGGGKGTGGGTGQGDGLGWLRAIGEGVVQTAKQIIGALPF